MTGSLVVPFIHDLHINLQQAMFDLKSVPPSDDDDFNNARAAVMPCVRALHKDLINRWGDGSNMLTNTEGNRRLPRSFKSVCTGSRNRYRPAHQALVWDLEGPACRRVEARAERSGEDRAADPRREQLRGWRVIAIACTQDPRLLDAVPPRKHARVRVASWQRHSWHEKHRSRRKTAALMTQRPLSS